MGTTLLEHVDRNAAEHAELTAVVDGPRPDPPAPARRFAELVDKAEAALAEREAEVAAATATVRPDSPPGPPITIVYTSGTTGPPKGTVLTHAGVEHVMDGIVGLAERSGLPLPPAGAAALSYLPLAHVAERMFSHYLAIRRAATVTYLRDYRKLPEALPAVRPHLFPGEILARGPNVTPGYLNQPDATREAIDRDGWLHTGDLGSLDADGYLRITGGKKELIINAAGKNISPANVEQAVSGASDLLGPVSVHGDNRPYLVALLTLDPLGWRDWCAARGIEVTSPVEAAEHPEVQAEARRAVEAGNRRLARVEQVERWTLLPDLWDTASGELTPTLKLKRPVIARRYRTQLDQLYEARDGGC